MGRHDNLITGRTAQLPLIVDGEPISEHEVRHSAQWRPGSVHPVASVEGSPRSLTVTLPWPPSVNDYLGHRVAVTKGGATGRLRCPACRVAISGMVMPYHTAKAKDFRREVASILSGTVPLAGRLAVTIQTHQPTRRARDLDNLGKVLLDAMTAAGAWEDDSQIDDLRFVRGEVVKGGSVDVLVSTILPAGFRPECH